MALQKEKHPEFDYSSCTENSSHLVLWAIVKWSLDNHGNYESFMLRGGKSYNWDWISQVLGPVRLLFKDLFKTAMKSLFWIRFGCLFFPFCSVQLEARFPIAMTVMFLLLFSSHIAIITKNSEKREEEKKKNPRGVSSYLGLLGPHQCYQEGRPLCTESSPAAQVFKSSLSKEKSLQSKISKEE